MAEEETKIYYSAKHYCYYAMKYKEEAQQILAETRETGANLDAQLKATGAAQTALVTAEGTKQVDLVTDEGDTQVALVIAEGNTQVSNVTDVGDTQVALVTEEGNTQVQRVTSEGDTQVSRVISTGNTQVSRVEETGSEQITEATRQATIATQQATIATEKATFATYEADRAEKAASGVYNPVNHDLSNLTETGELKLSSLPQSLYQNTTATADMAGATTITLVDGQEVYSYNVTADSVLTFDASGIKKSGNTITFELKLYMATVRAISYNNFQGWLNDAPDMSTNGKTYLLVFRSDDGGQNWYGSFQGFLFA